MLFLSYIRLEPQTLFLFKRKLSNENYNFTLLIPGLDKDGKIVSYSSLAVKHISGTNIMDNHSVNLLSTIIIGLLMPTIVKNL